MTSVPVDQDAAPEDTFSARLVLVRHELGMRERKRMLSVEEIAARCRVKASTWSSWERGTEPHNKTDIATRIEEATGYSRVWIAWGGAFRTGSFLTTVDLPPGQLEFMLAAPLAVPALVR